MKSVKPWVDALSVSHADYQKWCEAMPAEASVTYWCLANGHIPPGEYLQWAQEHYGLATLRPEFFENPPNQKIFEMMKSVANWSPEMIPIYEWDGVVFVACVEPMADMKWSFPVCYVLASSSELFEYWQALQKAAQTAAPPPVAPPPALETKAPVAPPKPELTIAPPPPPEDTNSEIKIDDGPGGLNLNIQTVRKDRDFLAELASQVGADDETPAPIKPLPPEDDNMPAGMTLNLSTATPPLPEMTFTAINAQNPVTSEALDSSIAPPPAAKSAPTAAAPAMAAATPAAGAAPSAMSEQAKTFGEPFFRDMQVDYEGAMILTVEGDRLMPWTWDQNFAPPTHKGPMVDLSKPSAFRIAYRTKMPYLGHVVETPVNKEFFSGWGYAQMPENIVAHPLLQKGQFFGILLLKAKKSQKQSHVLMSSEQFASRITHALAQIKTKAA